ncbi:MAG: gluconate 5-dehydrogenase [Bacteroidales bacterium]|nr:gluconate 5-dehydrogenase [Bacteroidales bacterium]
MSQLLFDLKGKTALITGGTHGLGMAIATGLAEAGASIIINGHSPAKLESARQTYANKGISAHTYLLDIRDEAEAERIIPIMEKEAGPIDILVNNAAIIKRIPILEMKAADFREILDVNLTGQFIMAKAVARGMVRRRSGKIINICSMMSELGRDTVSAYAAAKGGLKMLTRNMATEWARYNIQINGLGPGYFATEQTAPLRAKGHPLNEFIIARTPAGRWGNPEDLAGTAVFLASRASDFVNGQIIYVDGGILATIGKPSNEE